MKYSIMGFSQEKLVELQKSGVQIDTTDLILMKYVKDAIASPSMVKTFENEQPYVWLAHQHILEDLPFMDIQEQMLKKRIKKLIDGGLLKSIVLANGKCRGTRAYYGITELFESLEYNAENVTKDNLLPLKETTKDNLLYLKEGPEVKNYPSNPSSNLDNKLNNNISNTILKDSTAKKRSPIVNTSNTFNTPKRNIVLMDSINDKAYGNEKEEKQKEKKLNMYQKCILEIDNYTADETLRQALKDYLSIRLKITGDKKLLGVSQWKGMLNKLSILKGDKVAIVREATANGWAGFFEQKNSKWNNKPNKAIFGEAENMKTVKPEEVEGGEFSGQIF